MKKRLVTSESQLKKLKAKLDPVNHRAAYWKRVNDLSSDCSTKRKKLRDEIVSLKEKVARLSLDNAELNETVQLKKNLLLLIGVIEEPDPSSDGGIQLSDIMLNPELLVGEIKHCFQVGLELVWYNGTVISMNPNTIGEDDIT